MKERNGIGAALIRKQTDAPLNFLARFITSTSTHASKPRVNMALENHIIDPDADTVITLKDASTVFATWDEIELTRSQNDEEPDLSGNTSSEPGTSESTMAGIIHSRHKQIPRTVTLEMLAKIAVLVEYYECGDTVEIYTSMWIDHITKCVIMPTTYCHPLDVCLLGLRYEYPVSGGHNCSYQEKQ
jgi:hypothetical protein